jgi:hypothetical protein
MKGLNNRPPFGFACGIAAKFKPEPGVVVLVVAVVFRLAILANGSNSSAMLPNVCEEIEHNLHRGTHTLQSVFEMSGFNASTANGLLYHKSSHKENVFVISSEEFKSLLGAGGGSEGSILLDLANAIRYFARAPTSGFLVSAHYTCSQR